MASKRQDKPSKEPTKPKAPVKQPLDKAALREKIRKQFCDAFGWEEDLSKRQK